MTRLVLPEQLGTTLRTSRRAAKLTQKQLALQLGVQQSRLSDMERAPETISLGLLLRWVTALGLQLSVAPIETRPVHAPDIDTQPDW